MKQAEQIRLDQQNVALVLREYCLRYNIPLSLDLSPVCRQSNLLLQETFLPELAVLSDVDKADISTTFAISRMS